MPWKDTCAMEERVKFVMEFARGYYTMAELCRIYGISRRVGYKWLGRYVAGGVEDLQDRSRAPKHHPNRISPELEAMILAVRRIHPRWGPKKLRVVLKRRMPNRGWPATSTIGEILHRAGLTVPRKRRRRTPPYTQPFMGCDSPNAVWCADFKGWFRTGDGSRCDPLTISDAHSRYLLRCQIIEKMNFETTHGLFEATFRQYGLPLAIRTDNGSPFAGRGLGGLSRLSVWWVRLGIVPERIEPGKPQQNGRHERMHGTLHMETAKPPAKTLRGQQRAFDRFRREFNHERPHEALEMRCPTDLYTYSPRPYPERLEEFDYGDLQVRRVQDRGEFMWKHRKVFLSKVFWGELIGLEPLDGCYWAVYFGTLQLGVFDSYRYKMLTTQEAGKVGHGGRSFRYAPSPSTVNERP